MFTIKCVFSRDIDPENIYNRKEAGEGSTRRSGLQ